jgi:hypothetical protein
MVIVWLVSIVVLGIAVLGMLLSWFALRSDRILKEAIANAPAILDASFDGRENVAVKTTWVSLPYEQVIIGAKDRGYRLTNQTGTSNSDATLIFEKIT